MARGGQKYTLARKYLKDSYMGSWVYPCRPISLPDLTITWLQVPASRFIHVDTHKIDIPKRLVPRPQPMDIDGYGHGEGIGGRLGSLMLASPPIITQN